MKYDKDKAVRALTAFQDKSGLKDFPWEKAAGVGPGTLRKFREQPHRSMTAATYEKLAKGASKLLGEEIEVGEIMDSSRGPQRGRRFTGTPSGKAPERAQLTFADAGSVTIVELDVHAQAGIGADGEFEITQSSASDSVTGRYTFPASGFREAFGANPSDVIVAEVLGDSMMPTLAPGQKVLINTADKRPSPPGLFCLWDGLALVIKRVELIAGSNPPTVRIKSDNGRYDTYDRTLEEAHINGRIVLGFTRF